MEWEVDMRVTFFAMIAAVTLAGAPAPALAHDLAGRWTGGYISADGADVNTFDVTIAPSQGDRLTGTVIETNALSSGRGVLFLTSRVSGSVVNGVVSFVKTYDGSGGVSHSVSYSGRMDATGRRIAGSYDAGGATGRFEMVR